MAWLDLDEGIVVNTDRIIALEKADDFSSIVYVDFGGKSKSFERKIPFDTLRRIILGKSANKSEQYLEQLAKYQATTVL